MTKETLDTEEYTDGKIIAKKMKDSLDHLEKTEGADVAKEILDTSIAERSFSPVKETLIDKSLKDKEGQKRMERLRQIGELKQQDEIRQEINRLYEESHPEEIEEREDERVFQADRTMMKVVMGSRHATKSESAWIEKEAENVTRFVESFGKEALPIERMINATLVSKKASVDQLGNAGSIGDGENRLINLNPRIFRFGDAGRFVVDHEFLHMYQSRKCPGALVEGVTSLYTMEMQSTISRKLLVFLATLGTPYVPDHMCAGIYRSIVGETALASAYFEGNVDAFQEEYKGIVGSKSSLDLQFRLLENSRKLARRKNVVTRNIAAIPSTMLGLAATALASGDYIRSIINKSSRAREISD